jgi:hypothetical protein
MNTLATILISGLVSLGAWLGLNSQPALTPEMANLIDSYLQQSQTQLGGGVQPLAGTTFNLSGGGITSSQTSITLQSLTISQSPISQKIEDSDLSDTFYITIEPGNRTRQEIVSCTTVTQNANNTATLSGCTRGLEPIPDYSASTTLAFSHPGSSQVIFSDPPQLFNQYAAKSNIETIDGRWIYSLLPESTVTPTSTDQFTRKGYVDNLAFSGAGVVDASITAKGVSEFATQLETGSSTASGASGPLVIANSTATDTPNTATKASRVIVSDRDGKIKNGWLDLTGYLGKASTTQISATQAIYNTGTTTLATTTLDMRALNDTNLGLTGVGWTLIASTTVTSNTATATLAIPNRRHIQIIVSGRILTNASAYMILNGDSAINYSYHNASSTGGMENKGTGQRKIPITTNGGQFTSFINFFNPNTTIKSLRISSVGEPVSPAGTYSSTTAPFPSDIAAIWATSTAQQVTNFSITGDEVANGSGGVAAGTVIQVYGSGF